MNDNIETLACELRTGNRRALAKAITLIESRKAADRPRAAALLEAVGTPDTPSLRIGLTGTPGVGKSSLIETLGLRLTAAGHRVAVLAVDPSSTRSGGSILGDKTRMEQLSRDPAAFIRPSPAQTQLGGVARRTREVIQLVEAAGYDIVLVETVGVGQSETLVAGMTDIFVLLLAPAGGDELQGVKRGIMEMADLILVNKADGALEAQAQATRADYLGALSLLRKRVDDPAGFPTAMCVSALTGSGLEDAWTHVVTLSDARTKSGAHDRQRQAQNRNWFREELDRMLLDHVAQDSRLSELREQIEAQVEAGTTTPAAGAETLLAAVLSH